MIPPLLVARAAAAAVTLTLAANSARNIGQTVLISRDHARGQKQHTTTNDASRNLLAAPTTDGVISQLQTMKKRDLLQLFLSSEAPSNLDIIVGEWNGILLDNNGLTSVSNFLTNKLFSRGRTWNGKAFLNDGSTGTNRFLPNETQHQFDYSLCKSPLGTKDPSVKLVYKKYQSPISLWRTMSDEVRVLRLDVPDGGEILLGMGCMAWSGGIMNGAPFCLWRMTEANDAQKVNGTVVAQ